MHAVDIRALTSLVDNLGGARLARRRRVVHPHVDLNPVVSWCSRDSLSSDAVRADAERIADRPCDVLFELLASFRVKRPCDIVTWPQVTLENYAHHRE